MTETYVLDAVRTPIGRFGGALAGVRPDDLAGHVVRSLIGRAADLDPHAIDDVFFGDANGAGEDNRDVADGGPARRAAKQRARRDAESIVRIRHGGPDRSQPRNRGR